jgi:hypothetical protein
MLKEQVRLEGVGISSTDWTSYPVLTFSEVPEVTVELVNAASEQPPLAWAKQRRAPQQPRSGTPSPTPLARAFVISPIDARACDSRATGRMNMYDQHYGFLALREISSTIG